MNTWEERSAAVKIAAAVTLLVSTGRASRRPRYHPTTPALAQTAPVFLLGGATAGPTGDGRAGGKGVGRGAEGGGLEEMRWVRKWDQGETLRRRGRRRRPPAWKAPAVAMAAAAAAAAGGQAGSWTPGSCGVF